MQGVPQGLAVYQNGSRINEAFGDIVNFDLIPPQAIQRIDVVTGNPVFGLNALGGAVNIQMKNGFTWQGTEISAWGGSDARTAGYLQYGKVSGPWSVYFTGDGLNDRGWRYESPSTIGRIYGDVGYRSQDAEFHLIGLAARSFFGAAAATPVDFTRNDPRAIFTYPQTTTTEVGTLQLTGRVDLSPTWDLAGNAYFRRFSQTYIDGNDGNFENCSTRSSFRGRSASRMTASAGRRPVAARLPQPVPDPRRPEPDDPVPGEHPLRHPGPDADPGDRLRRLAAGGQPRPVFGLGNAFVVGGSIDVADYSFKSSSTLGVINPNLSITTDPNNPFYGNIPASAHRSCAPPRARHRAELGQRLEPLHGPLHPRHPGPDRPPVGHGRGAPELRAHLQHGPDRLLAGRDRTHYFNKINPVAGLTYRFFDALNLYGSYSESNRAPTPLELACANPDRPCLLPNSLVADPPLKQVTARTYEVGFRGLLPNTYDGGTISYKIGAFRTDLANDILSLAVPGNAARAYFVNVPATQRQGIEVGGEYEADYLRVYANYALVDATFQFNGTLSSPNNPLAVDGAIQVTRGNTVPLVPNHQIKAASTTSSRRTGRSASTSRPSPRPSTGATSRT